MNCKAAWTRSVTSWYSSKWVHHLHTHVNNMSGVKYCPYFLSRSAQKDTQRLHHYLQVRMNSFTDSRRSTCYECWGITLFCLHQNTPGHCFLLLEQTIYLLGKLYECPFNSETLDIFYSYLDVLHTIHHRAWRRSAWTLFKGVHSSAGKN